MIVKTALLACTPQRAFELFTQRAGEWWPADRRHTDDATSTIRIEATGRFYERASDGNEVELGVVRLFEPARRLIIDWYPGTGADAPTRVEVRFESERSGTRITELHDAGAAGTERFTRNAPRYAASWDHVFEALRGA